MAEYGAKHATLSDINPKAVDNTRKNIEKHRLNNADVYESDLFNDLPYRKYDTIVFNHPFFPGGAEKFKGDPNNDIMLRKSMLGGTELIKRFFDDAPDYLRSKGTIVMPYFHFAGPENDPVNHVKKYKMIVSEEHKIDSHQGLQLGGISIYVITESE